MFRDLADQAVWQRGAGRAGIGLKMPHGPSHFQSCRRLRSPLVWFGGKGVLARRIVKLFPSHHLYVEPFCGGASCLFAKGPSPVEVLNDINSDIVNFFRVLRDPGKFEQLHRLAALTPYSWEEFARYRGDWLAGWQECADEVERAYRWYVVARMSFAGEFGRSWGYSVGTSRLGMANAVAQWLSIVDLLPAIAERVRTVQIEYGAWLEVLERYDTPDTLFYVDPPFVRSTRSGGKYQHEMDDRNHSELVGALLSIRGKAVLSGYRNPIYLPLEEAGWECVDLATVCYAVGRTRFTGLQGAGSLRRPASQYLRTERLWISPTAHHANSSSGPVACGFRRSNQYVQGRLNLDGDGD